MLVRHKGRDTISVGATAVDVTDGSVLGAIPDRTRYVEIQVQGASIRVTFDGSTTPVADTTGELWVQYQLERVWGLEAIGNLKFVRDGSTSATLELNYYGDG